MVRPPASLHVKDAAADAGLEKYPIEQGFTGGDPIESIRQSVAFLRKTNVA